MATEPANDPREQRLQQIEVGYRLNISSDVSDEQRNTYWADLAKQLKTYPSANFDAFHKAFMKGIDVPHSSSIDMASILQDAHIKAQAATSSAPAAHEASKTRQMQVADIKKKLNPADMKIIDQEQDLSFLYR
ncbi:MAG: hypothetical protein AB7H77_02340 [Bdellovibrionales bacterium]